jgi:hypothetical protein
MPKADLPTVRSRIQQSRQYLGKVLIPATDLGAVLTELEAARQVVAAARALDDERLDPTDVAERLADAIAAYDQAVT